MLMFAIFLAGAAWIGSQGLVLVVLTGIYPAEICAIIFARPSSQPVAATARASIISPRIR
jgi:hypothetical protein